MKNEGLWIAVAIAVLGALIVGGVLLLRGADGGAPPSVGMAQGSVVGAGEDGMGASESMASVPQERSGSDLSLDTSTEMSLAALASGGATVQTPPASLAQAPSPEVTSAPAGLVPIEKLIKNAGEYEGRIVTIKGEILAQCAAGCEFSVDDGTGVLSVQLEGAALDKVLAKGSVGKKVEVTGVFRRSPRPQLAVEKLGSWRLF